MKPTLSRPSRRARLAALAAAGAVSAGLIFFWPAPHAVGAQAARDAVPGAVASGPPAAGFADLVEKIRPAVVNVSTTTARAAAFPGRGPRLGDPRRAPFKRHFPRRGMPPLPPHSLGSGFIIDADGHVVTNHHVIDGADEIEVVLEDGRRRVAAVVGSDPESDVALLKIEADAELPRVAFGDDARARVGDWVLAIGNPFGLGGTTTTGIISARGRNINAGPYDDFIQIDAPINRGNSGGPLFNLDGEVIGVNSVIYSPHGGNVGIGFAIPATQVKAVVSQLRARGYVTRAWLGVSIQPLTEDLATALGLDHDDGALISTVRDASPAHRAGLKAGDVVVSFDGERVARVDELPRLVADSAPGREVEIGIVRDGRRRVVTARLETRGETGSAAAPRGRGANAERVLGMRLEPLTDEARRRLNLDDSLDGVLIGSVRRGSDAARKGLKTGDVIRQVGDTVVAAPRDVEAGIAGAGRGVVLLRVTRAGNDRFVALRTDRSPS